MQIIYGPSLSKRRDKTLKDTSISVESSLREAFNVGYNVILISDATASNNKKHYESTIENVREYYGLVMSIDQLSKYLHQ